MIEVKDKFWVVEDKNKRFLFETEKEAISKWQESGKNSEPKLNEIGFTSDGLEYKQVSWEKIAMLLAKGEGK